MFFFAWTASAAAFTLSLHDALPISILMAAIDGIKNQIDPGKPMDKNIYDLPPEELATIPSTCKSLEEAINEMEDRKSTRLNSSHMSISYAVFRLKKKK